MTRPTRRALAALAVSTLLATAACGGSSGSEAEGDDVAAAAEAGQLVVYSGRNEKLVGPLIEDFEQASGIEVAVRYGGSAELAAQLVEEGDRSPAAVFLSQDAGALGAVQDAGLLAPLPATVLEQVPERYRSDDGRWVGVSGRSRVLVYNSADVQQADLPDSVFDLVEPQYRGKVGYAPTNASFQTFVTGMRVAVGDERTREWLEAFKANDPKAYDNNLLTVDAVNDGEVPFGLVNHYYLYERAAEAGGLEELEARNHLFPGDDPGSLVNVAGVGVLASTGADPQASEFVEFLLSQQAQRYFAEQTKEYPLVAGVEAEEGLPPLESLQGPELDLSDLASLEETLALLDEVGLT